MLKWLFNLLGDNNEKKIKVLYAIVSKINDLESEISALSDSELKNKTAFFKNKLQKGLSLEDILPEAFAVVREAAKRTVNMRHFDVQLLGGIVLHRGKIAEMKTGEGKTLVATLPAYLNALSGKGVHIVTVNDYLAARDAKWMGPVYEFLGLSVGVILANQNYEEKKTAYAKDITYGTNNEFGFDYLRDNMATHIDQCVQRTLNFSIVDEVDSILIDEARTPLIISGQVEGSVSLYPVIYKITQKLQKEIDYKSDEKQKNISLTEEGIAKAEKILKVDSLYDIHNMDTAHILIQCLKAKEHFHKDIDYMVKDKEIVIVDEFTGRLMIGRRYSDGLHQAIEAKENVPIKEENQTLASITFQNYFRMYSKLAGMTGTAMTEEAEFAKTYNLESIEVPTNKPCIRQDQADVIYKSKLEKYKAVVRDIITLHKEQIPILVGTISIETSELISSILSKEGIPHHVLNAKYHEQEAEIISKAGQLSAVTIATNMAGRGTDIVLAPGVVEKGGLHILGTERHESRRIDNQLRGRAGRQGDPGTTRFYISLEDDLMRLFGSDRIRRLMDTLGLPDDTPIEHGMITRSIERAQHKVEQYYFGIRKQVLQYDDVMNRQRNTLYALRRNILEGNDIKEKIREMIQTTSEYIISNILQENTDFTRIKKDLIKILQDIINKSFSLPDFKEDKTALDARLIAITQKILDDNVNIREKELGASVFSEIMQVILLKNIDSKWMDHLYNLDNLRDGIGLRAYGQKDPLIEYKIEGFQLFQEMLVAIAEESLRTVFRIEIVTEESADKGFDSTLLSPIARNISYTSSRNASPSLQQPQKRQKDKIGRNAPCTCGSGKKYKKCCGKTD